MRKSLSFKIGLLFFIFILLIEVFLFYILYTNLAQDRIEEVMNSLLTRGNTHRDVLEDHFDKMTLEHVGIMESASEFIVVITDAEGKVNITSDPIDDEILAIVDHTHDDRVPTEGKIVEDRWKEAKYVATDSPVTIDGVHEGHVFMFAESNFVKRTVDQLTRQFLITGIMTVLLTILTIFILSRIITEPLIRMKQATEQLSVGNFKVKLHTERTDELGDLAHAITKLAGDLKRLKAARNEFLASVSHELRTPLTYIKGYADIVNRPETPTEDVQKYLQILREESEQLSQFIKNLFQLAKIDQNNFVIKQEPIDLSAWMQQFVKRMKPILAKKQITIELYTEGQIIALIDPERFQQVMTNLIDNAKKHSEPHSTITLRLSQTKTSTKITVTDEGEGIPKADLPYIFDRLYRVEKSRSRESGGSGLGLSITKEIIESHGGTIQIESEVGQGTTVIIIFHL